MARRLKSPAAYRGQAERVFGACASSSIEYSPEKSNPAEPSIASIRDENFPATRRSPAAAVVCQSGDALFQALMSSGELRARQTSAMGAATTVETVIFTGVPEGSGKVACEVQPSARHGHGAAFRSDRLCAGEPHGSQRQPLFAFARTVSAAVRTLSYSCPDAPAPLPAVKTRRRVRALQRTNNEVHR